MVSQTMSSALLPGRRSLRSLLKSLQPELEICIFKLIIVPHFSDRNNVHRRGTLAIQFQKSWIFFRRLESLVKKKMHSASLRKEWIGSCEAYIRFWSTDFEWDFTLEKDVGITIIDWCKNSSTSEQSTRICLLASGRKPRPAQTSLPNGFGDYHTNLPLLISASFAKLVTRRILTSAC